MEFIIEIEKIYNTLSKNDFAGFISGDGKIPSDILFVGEAPGKMEVELKKPFVGLSGKTFEFYLNSIGIKRDEIRITNTCFARPIRRKISKSGRETISNRPPKTDEIKAFRNILNEEINMVNPKIIITLGNTPLKRLTGEDKIGVCHGKVIYNEEIEKYIFPMYHPSALTYNHSAKFLEDYRSDWVKLKEYLDKL